MNYRTLTNKELVRFAEQDSRYEVDALYTELVERVRSTDISIRTRGDDLIIEDPEEDDWADNNDSSKPLQVDVHG